MSAVHPIVAAGAVLVADGVTVGSGTTPLVQALSIVATLVGGIVSVYLANGGRRRRKRDERDLDDDRADLISELRTQIAEQRALVVHGQNEIDRLHMELDEARRPR